MLTPKILCGPFGSYIKDTAHTTVQALFWAEQLDPIRSALRAYREAGIGQPVTPTYGASPRGVKPEKFINDFQRWNTDAALLTKGEFPDIAPWGSVATILDTTRNDDQAWAQVQYRTGVAYRAHTPQLQALIDANVQDFLLEAVHDLDETIGFVRAAEGVGARRAIVSFQPTITGLPLHAEGFSSYAEILDRLRQNVRGSLQVSLGLNCDNLNGIERALKDNPPGTFAAVYPNACDVTPGDKSDEFWHLANKNHKRTSGEDRRFDELRKLYAVPRDRLLRMINLAKEKSVECVGLCCGADPESVGELKRIVDTTQTVCQPQILEA